VFAPRYVDVDDVLLHVETAGPDDGPPVLFLHGWPDLWTSFLPQMRDLAGAGFRVLAPDQRGYGLSGKPAAVADYAMPRVTQDAMLLVERLAGGPVHLVGHDWGGSVAWTLAMLRPDLVRSLTVVNCPHPAVFGAALRRSPAQWLRSWYMLLFQVPGLAETLLSVRGGAVLAAMLRHGARMDAEVVAMHRLMWRYPGAISRPLNWYRALPGSLRQARLIDELPVVVPTQILWGTGDPAFRNRYATDSAALCDDRTRVEWFEGGHWPQNEEPRRVTRLLHEWFDRYPVPAAPAAGTPRTVSIGEA